MEDESLAQKQAELGGPLPDLEKLIPIAQRVLTNPAGLWKEARDNARLALQSFLFPEGVTFDGQSFGTVVTLRSAAYARGKARRGRW